MSIGFGHTKADMDPRMGTLADDVRQSLRRAAAFKALLDNTTVFANDQAIIDLGYTQTEVNTIRAVFNSLNALNNVANGLAAQTPANNFLFDVPKITGVVV